MSNSANKWYELEESKREEARARAIAQNGPSALHYEESIDPNAKLEEDIKYHREEWMRLCRIRKKIIENS